ncbi:type I polyketide synthase [Actinomadura algeriensis]|uniref:Phthiocerol/phenolphthiocerol synthesis type-I polyketide synthase B n=1 Tax=Actinomadura algeriensis TaxID=1679523 RepID=A0ABR9JIP1_9ACTN|nr:type I polyketide synthase [Actinomadura algeriensis]MBE1530411.1 phthiocerol/phenolphthiocerol synthesis type-I polyketide synthase B [Actinomadura algeriensis]
MTGIGERLAGLAGDRRDELDARSRAAAATIAGEPIAIVGMACRLPGGVNDAQDYWELLLDGRNAVGEVPADRWDADALYDPDPHVPGRMNSRWGGFLDDVAGFDAEFFGISPREAAAMDPQQRILLEVAWEALEQAGIEPGGLAGSRTGVFAGIYHSDYRGLQAAEPDAYSSTGTAHSVAVGRIGYLLGSRGPGVAVDTACSASLVSAHLAGQSLRLREIDLAVVGGVNVILDPGTQIAMSQWGMLAPDGRCKSFDAAADGFVRGEGCGVVVLKRLVDAVRDGDAVTAVIRGSAVNSDGRSQGVTAPSGIAQREVMRSALERAGVAPESVGYVESHGTGTTLGDPIEFESLHAVYGTGGGTPPCALGAVKTNIGHLESAAGVVGLIKAALAVRHGTVPPNLHFDRWNPAIDAGGSRFFVPGRATPWPSGEGVRRAAVSSFGFSGTNAHVVLEEHVRAAAPPADPGLAIYPVAATSPERMRDTAGALASWLAGDGGRVPPADLGRTLARRADRPARGAVVAATREELVAGLAALAGGRPSPNAAAAAPGTGAAGPVWVFSGQGGQWPGMARELLEGDAAFAAAVAELDPIVRAEAGFSPAAVLRAGRPDEMSGVARVQPLLFTMQLALAESWRSHGVEPAAVIGHSMGEIAAAVVARALSPRDGAAIVCRRSRLLATVAGQGSMAAVEAPVDRVRAAVSEAAALGEVDIAVHAGPNQTVVSGTAAAMRALMDKLTADGIDVREIKVDVASHSPLMDPLAAPLREALDDLRPARPEVPFHSTVYGPGDGLPALDADYWAANLRRPVRFADAVRAAAEHGHRLFLEVGPHPVLGAALDDTLLDALGDDDFTVAWSMRRDEPARREMLTALAKVYTAGHPVPWDGFFRAGTMTAVPPTPWRHRRFWAETARPNPPSTEPVPAPEWMSRVVWPVAEPAEAPARPSGDWLVVAQDDGDEELAADLVDRLRAVGATARSTRRPDAAERAPGATGVILLVTRPAAGGDPARAGRTAAAVLGLARSLAAPGRTGRLWLVTRGAQAVGGEPELNAAHAPVWGLGRWLAAQHPGVHGGLIDLAPVPTSDDAACVLAELGAGPDDAQAAYRDGTRHVPRLRPVEDAPAGPVRPIPGDGVCVVVGGTGRIGPALLPGLVRLGARHLVVVSRGGLRGESAAAAERLRAEGVPVGDVRADVADEAAVQALFRRFGTDLPPLRAIVQAALTDGTARLEDMDEAHLAAMFASKVDGSALLDRLSEEHDVRCFLGFSALAALFGGWDPAYAAANCYLETLVHARRLRGLPGHVVNWGAWREGIEGTPQQSLFEGAGLRLMPGGRAVRTLGPVLADAAVQTVVADADWNLLGRADAAVPSPLLRELTATAPESGAGPEDGGGPPEGGRESLRRHVRAAVAEVLKFPEPEALGVDQNFFDIGLDSLMSLLIQRRLRVLLGRPLPPLRLSAHPTVEILTDRLHQLLNEPPSRP